MIAALEEIKSKENPECSGQANNLTLALLSPAFLVSLHVTEYVLAVTLPLSRKLQAKNTDLSAAIADIDVVKRAIQNDRTNADKLISKIFAKVQGLAGKLNVEITSRRVGIRQQRRGSMPAETPEEYFRKTMFTPFADFTLAQLNERFEKQRALIHNFRVLIPSTIPPGQNDREREAKELVSAFALDVDEKASLGKLITLVDQMGEGSTKLASHHRT